MAPSPSPTSKRKSLVEAIDNLVEHPKLGILRLDYDYPAAPGDIDHASSFGYPVVYRVVPGLTFQMAQSGELTAEVGREFDDAIRYLTEEKGVSAITGDCGFMFWFQKRAHVSTHIPVFISALIQLPSISSALCKENDKVVIITANVESLKPMQDLINEVTGSLEEHMHYAYVGCEDVPHFGDEVEQGLKVDTAKAEPGILKKVKDAVAMYPNAKAILLECTELPPYADTIRAETGLPVYDAITCCNFVMSSFQDNERFGRDSWYKPWDGTQEDYTFGQYLSSDQRAKLVTKPVDEKVMKMITEQLQNAQLFDDLKGMGMAITAEEAANAIAHQIEMNELHTRVVEIEAEMKRSKKKKFVRVRQLFARFPNLVGKLEVPGQSIHYR